MSFITRLIVLVLVGCSLATGTATAAEGFNDIVYVEKEQEVPSGERTSLSVFCPGGRPVISGGIHITGTDLSIEVASTAPIDGRRDADKIPDDGWRAAANNDSGETETMTVRAQCAEKVARQRLRYKPTTRQSLEPGSIPLFQAAYCGEGYSVVGGGVTTSGSSTRVMLHADHSEDDPAASDPDQDPDDVWVGGVTNASTKAIAVKTTAICVNESLGGAWSYPGGTLMIAPGAQSPVSASCPSDGSIAFGGGARATHPQQNIASIEMVQAPGGATNGWRGWFNNPDTETRLVFVRTICWAD